jgi:DNA modification methylase
MSTRKPRSTAITAALKLKARQRRQSSAEQTRVGDGPHSKRNDLRPRLELVDVPIVTLRGARRRIHRHDEAHVAEIIGSLGTFGVSRPILISGDREIVDGHDVVEAARRLGLHDLPCIVIDHLSPEELRMLSITLNRLPEKARWDLDTLALELSDLAALDLDIPLEVTGFSTAELDLILMDDESGAPETSALEPTADAKPVSRRGDLWTLGDHLLLNGDALLPDDYDQLMGLELARLCLTDPPYNVEIKNNVTRGDHREFVMGSGEMTMDQFSDFLFGWMDQARSRMVDGGMIASFIDWRGVGLTLNAGMALDLHLINIIVWNKTNAGMGSLWRSKHELLPVFKVGTAPHVNNVKLGKEGRWRSNVWDAPGASSLGSDSRDGLKLHPTVKPVALLQDALMDVTHRGDIVLEPFMGSGSTMMACQRMGRRCRGLELDPLYVDVAIRRWQEATGREARLEATGETFTEVTRRRLDGSGPKLLPKPRLRIAAGSRSEGLQ